MTSVFNGDIGVLAGMDEDAGTAVVAFDERRVEYRLDALDQLEPAYAIVPQVAGSEFAGVVMPLIGGHFMC
jgi:ATP-dependent exoDNAse (exonuclease V) alpha subunit